ncbi:biotin--[acetyl-CoA-carboxylase] ligase [Microbacterium horticulturae]|uniref:biotin--[biotin carboxyl-carrier protein] ligase n=1 Tax=Microbacterium horticulturae TaxID=3028316 RepID=A0ABY8BWM3_9MICO|nr:biotin--[acetyl-CoA-carboxylase] ligase [Microbacterium sp. KACC 23027]WEG07922.1 biotin--[acetyl-CoA-carboxylase] ligase [Microbacterium sp. KACC 23027]
MTDAYPRIASVTPRLRVVASTGSTNADAVAGAAADPVGWPHLAVLLTADQRSGRGRLDRTWTTPAGAALAVSVLVRIPRIPVERRGWVPLAAGAAMTRAVGAQLRGSGHTVGLKWPNDVLVDGGKICGILASVVPGEPDAVVIGSGVNTRMRAEDLPVPTATSFAALEREVDEDQLIADYLVALDEQLSALARGGAGASGVRGEVEALCLTLGSDVRVSMPNGEVLLGRAQRLDDEGRLVVAAGADETAVSAGDVVHVRPDAASRP